MTALADLVIAAPLAVDADRAAGRLDDLRVALGRAAMPRLRRALAAPGAVHDLLLGIADGSSFLWALSLRDPKRLERLLADDPAASLEASLRKARRACDAAASQDDIMRALRLLKQDAALLLGLADLGGVWDVVAVTAALTRVADRAVSCALRWLLRQAANAGRVEMADRSDPERGCGLFVLAMGKHGACELNYSSDIDLIVLYDPDLARPGAGLESSALFVKMTQAMVRLLSERTPDGYVFRVDLRLRPDPGATAVAISLPAAFGYYESVGQNWERAAFIKARPCAGDLAAGERFLSGLRPFVWRRHLDYAAIADVHAMKRQIHVHKGHETIAVAGHDLKLGRGGIREIEFFVQTQQLIAGGRNPALRGRSTLQMLRALDEAGWITREAADEIGEAYRFLRGLEHRLQMVADEQTHSLPGDPDALALFAAFSGSRDAGAFAAGLLRRLETVQRHYARLFETSPGLSSDVGSLVFTGKADDPETLATLARLGFRMPAAVARMISGWHFGRYPAMRSARAREDLTEITPALLAAFSQGGRPDGALNAFDALLGRMPSGYQLLSILRNNARLLDLLARILGVAPRLADLLATRPHALDGLLEPSGGVGRDEGAMADRMRSALAIADSHEDRLDGARIFVRERLFLIGARMLSGDLAPRDGSEEISALAAAAVAVLLDVVAADLAAVHGTVAGGAVCILALGKLGGREMTSTSDLDLIVLYDHAREAPDSDGPRPVPAPVWFARLTQRLIAAIAAPTAQGTIFDVDMRLRPSGRKGPVAIHVEGFAAYQRGEAWTWEHMALTRARPIAGDQALRERVSGVISDILTTERDAARVLADVAQMRSLMASEKGSKGRWDLKLAPGGLVDVEFIVQGLQLVHAHAAPGVLAVNTGDAMARLAGAGILSPGQHEVLATGWTLLSDLSQLVRLCVGRDLDPGRASEALEALLARAVGQPDFRILEVVLREHESAIRAVFRNVIEGTEDVRNQIKD